MNRLFIVGSVPMPDKKQKVTLLFTSVIALAASIVNSKVIS